LYPPRLSLTLRPRLRLRLLLLAPPAWPLDTAWSTRLVALDNMAKTLTTASAYISTLGGGHFMCKHVAEALAMAGRQMAVARALGDDRLLARCHVHVVYAFIQAGRFRSAMARLRVLRRVAARMGDTVLAAMVGAGVRYCRATHGLWASGTLDEVQPSAEDARNDELYRQRLVPLRLPAA
jgi:hypothetical protein